MKLSRLFVRGRCTMPLAFASCLVSSGSFGAAAWASYSDITARLGEAEYEASVDPFGLQAPNRAQNLRTRFYPSSITITSRDAGAGDAPWAFTWQLTRFGRASDMRDAGEPALSSSGTRVTYARRELSE